MTLPQNRQPLFLIKPTDPPQCQILQPNDSLKRLLPPSHPARPALALFSEKEPFAQIPRARESGEGVVGCQGERMECEIERGGEGVEADMALVFDSWVG
jgi:hypothetical protein